MDGLALWLAVLIASLAVLLRAADAFLHLSERLGLAIGLSPFVVGITLVAFGTSFPELLTGVVGVLRGASEIASSTAIGSNVTNILLVLAAAAVLGRGLRVEYELVRVDLPFLFGSALLMLLFAFDGAIGRIEGVLSLAALAVYLLYATRDSEAHGGTMGLLAPEVSPDAAREAATASAWVGLAVSAGLLQLAAYGSVESVLRISALTGIGSHVLGASVIAVGTSLPELAVTVRSALAGKPELAVGNVIGSNIFNALGVVGIAALVGPLSVPIELVTFALPAMLGATVLCFFVLQERVMTQWDGGLLLILYCGYVGELYRVF